MAREYLVHRDGAGRKTMHPSRGAAGASEARERSCRSEQVPAALPAAGLSKPHSVTAEPQNTPVAVTASNRVTYFKGAALVDIQGASFTGAAPVGGIRKEIKGLSFASGLRLKRVLAQILNSERGEGLAVCLTYPRGVVGPEEWTVYKNHVRVFNQAVKRHFGGSSGVWVLEFQKSGAPHFHLLICGLKGRYELKEIREWMQKRWYDIGHAGDIHEGKAGTNIEWVKSGGGVMGYMAKYMSKGHQMNKAEFTGRMWGKFGTLPFGEEVSAPYPPERIVKIQRLARKKMENDVNNARWNRFLQKASAWTIGGRLYWEQLKSAKHGGSKSIDWLEWQKGGMKVPYEDAEGNRCIGLTVEMWTVSHVSVRQLLIYRPPPKWKSKHNNRVRLLCDVDAFMGAVERAVSRGII